MHNWTNCLALGWEFIYAQSGIFIIVRHYWKRQLAIGRDNWLLEETAKWQHFPDTIAGQKRIKFAFYRNTFSFFRVVRCSRESVISAGTTPQDCFRNSHHHPLLVVWNLKEYYFFLCFDCLAKAMVLTYTRVSIQVSLDVLRKYSTTVSEKLQDLLEVKLNCTNLVQSNWECFPIGWFLIFVWVRQHVKSGNLNLDALPIDM